MSIRYHVFIVVSLITIALLGVGAAAAQDESTCLALVLSAVNQASTQCATVGENSVCYGYNHITGSFREETSPGVFTKLAEQDFFVEAGDQADLLITEAVQTGPVDFSDDPSKWGLAIMNVQASLPNEVIQSQGGKGVIFLMVGGVEVENGVEPEDVLVLPDQGMPVTTVAAADMRSAPVAFDTATGTNVMSRLPAAATVNAYAVSEDGNWVRVVFQGKPGWISRATLQASVDLSALPEVGPDTFTPMQSFYFRNGIRHGITENCASWIPSVLLVQGPDDIPVYLRVHGVDLLLESTAILRTVQPGDSLGEFFEVITLGGMVTIFPHTNREVLVPPGFVGRLRLGEFVSLGIEGDIDEKSLLGFVGPIRPITRNEAALFRIFERLPRNVLHYLFRIVRHIRASGIGGVIEQLVFDNPELLNAARRACESGRLPNNVCEILGL